MTLSPALIIFDCDGTLADSQHVIVEAMRLTFESADLAAPGRAAILRTVGLSMPEAIRVLTPEQFPETRSELIRSFRDHCAALRRQPHGQEQEGTRNDDTHHAARTEMRSPRTPS